MPSIHYIHLFDWDAAITARKSLGDDLFDPFLEIDPVIEEEEYGGISFLYGIEIPIDPRVNTAFGFFAFQGAPRCFDLITQDLAKNCDVRSARTSARCANSVPQSKTLHL